MRGWKSAARPSASAAPPPADGISPKLRLREAMRYIRREFAGAPRVRDVARAAGWSPLHLQRRFTEHYGRTVKQVVDELRIDEARRMLLRGVRHGEIARQL